MDTSNTSHPGPPAAGFNKPYPDPERPGCWRVPVASGKHPGMTALVDAESLPLVEGMRWNWSPGKPGNPNGGSVVLAVNGLAKPALGRVVLGVTDPEQLVAHVNGDRL